MKALFVPLLLALFASACTPRAGIVTLAGESMGSTWTVKYVGRDDTAARVRAAIEHELADIDAQMSTWKSESPLSRYNTAEAGTWHDWPESLFTVVQAALALAADTGGAYDPTVGPLVELWGFGPGKARREPPAADEIEAMRARVGWRKVRLDVEHRRVFQPGGLYLDLSSIAPGYATDRIGAYLEAQGCADYLVEIGGELRARGSKPDGSDWQVAIQRPLDNDSSDGAIDVQRIIALRDAALGSSGDYRHFFEDQGRRYAHRIDPRTGWPLDNDVASVTALAERGIDADPFATALSVLGPDAGLAWARERGVAVLFILRSGGRFEERMSDDFAARLTQ
ncbi:FAD:protein FMN transferase [Dokdonella sp.]|uniref:FAD:protein FMN transferase n=1 Tax=Dokdonella sp. TaxID=2291710 RepID=UPI0025BA52BD|nr:FAD:protein FMN transferase [Dokdonella sp.]MBX3693017.1 FAD:protein FMN transferase [Dokdonella sp.]MCW5568144.1 FAD:protein FMN transferase [Dokdonella sp.]